jgi:hypothetical protein
MATRAIDIITILHAISVLDGELKTTGWNSKNPQQKKIFGWLVAHREMLAKVTGLDAKASRFWEELNKFLTDHKFDPMVERFDPDRGIGVVSILDKLVKWQHGPGAKVQIRTVQGDRPGFELPAQGVNVYEVSGYPGSYLLELLTKSDDTLWLFVHNNNSLEGLDMAELSMDVMSRSRKTPMHKGMFGGSGQYRVFAGAQVLMLDFDIKPDISWMVGADTNTEDGGYFFIAQAAQQFKMRMDETGARVKVATVMVAMRGISEEPKLFVLDRPFYGWWTQKGLSLPMASFFADWDSLQKPAGSLEDL